MIKKQLIIVEITNVHAFQVLFGHFGAKKGQILIY